MKLESWRVEQIGEKPKRTWDDAVKRWSSEFSGRDTSYNAYLIVLRWLHPYFSGKLLTELTRDYVLEVVNIKRLESSSIRANFFLIFIGGILRSAAIRWEWIDKAPFFPLFPVKKGRIRWLTPEQVHNLFVYLPPYLLSVVKFALSTGLRRGNVLGLQWAQVDLVRGVAWVYADQAKGGRDIHVTLNTMAIEVLRSQVGKHHQYVFTNCWGKPIKVFNHALWIRRLKAAGISDFHFHDLRHTWASWLVQGGVPINVLQQMGGWRSLGMAQAYGHLSPAQFGTHAAVIDNAFYGTSASQHGEGVLNMPNIN